MKLSKNLGRIATTFLATAMLASVSAVPAFAAEESTVPGGIKHDTNYFKFTAGIKPNDDDTVYAPNVDIEYTLTSMDPAKDLPTGAAENLAKPGNVNALNTTDSNYDNTAELGGSTFADDVTFVFNPDTFGAVGIYYYTLTADVPAVKGLTPTEGTWTVKVYVQNKMADNQPVNGKFEIADVTMYKTGAYTDETDSWDDVTKSGDINGGNGDYAATYDTDKLTLTKELTGNMANMNDHFGFTITITDPDMVLDEGTATNTYASQVKYSVNGKAVEVPAVFTNGVATINVAANPGIGDGQSIVVSGIPETAKVEITEAAQGYNPVTTTNFNNDYEASWNGATVSEENDKTATVARIADGNNNVTVTNKKTTVNPTGIVMDIAPYALLVIVAAAGCFVFLRKRRED